MTKPNDETAEAALAFGDSDIPAEIRDDLYRDWTEFRDGCEAEGISPCINTFRSAYVLASKNHTKLTAELESLRALVATLTVFHKCPGCHEPAFAVNPISSEWGRCWNCSVPFLVTTVEAYEELNEFVAAG